MTLRAHAPSLLVSIVLAACGGDPPELGTVESGTETHATETGDGASEESDGDENGSEQESSGDGSSEEESGGGAACGNDVIEDGEDCDGSELGGLSCEELGFVGGEILCTDACTIDATGCTNQICGNGVLEGDEECDGNDFGGINCTDLGFGPGLPLCTEACSLDTSPCPVLGEGDPCGGFNPCENDLNCVSGTCYDGSPGDPCGNNNDCQSGDCEPGGFFEDGTCN